MEMTFAEKLQEFFDKTGVKKKHLALKAKCNQNTISAILKGQPISLEVALKIQKATDGYVTIENAGYKKEDYGL